MESVACNGVRWGRLIHSPAISPSQSSLTIHVGKCRAAFSPPRHAATCGCLGGLPLHPGRSRFLKRFFFLKSPGFFKTLSDRAQARLRPAARTSPAEPGPANRQ